MRLIDADALSKELDNLDKKYGIGSCGDGITICMEAVGKAPTIIDCGEMNHETMGKIPYMDLRPRMTEDKLNEITSRVCDIFSHIDCFGSWIPVEERLPENIDLVLVTWENTNPESYYKHIKGKKFCGAGHYCNGKWFWESVTCQDYLSEYGKCDWDEMDEAIRVIAWMPLPNPYEKEVES